MWYVATQNNGTRALGLQRALRLGSYHTARNWLEKLRLVISALPHDQLFGTVEVDLVLLDEVSVRKRNRSWEETPMVLVAAQQTASGVRRFLLRRITNASQANVLQEVCQMVEPDSEIFTDTSSRYRCLGLRGYNHLAVKSEAQFGEGLMPLVKSVAAELKDWLRSTCRGAMDFKHLDFSLAEFAFRFAGASRKPRARFERLVRQALQMPPLRNAMLHRRPAPN